MKESALAKLRETERQNRANHILAAAKTVFIKKGHKNATVRDIAREAELTTGAIYSYFKNKDTMYAKICKQILLDLNQHLETASSNKSGKMLDRVKKFFTAYIEYDEKHQDEGLLLSSNYQELKIDKSLFEELNSLLMGIGEFFIPIIKDGIKNGDLPETTNPEQYTLTLWAAVEGFLYLDLYGLIDHYGFKTKNLVINFLDSFIGGQQ